MPSPPGVSTPTEENLWNQAKDTLDRSEKDALAKFPSSERGEQLGEILRLVESKKNDYESRATKFQNDKLRDIYGNIALWVKRFESVGNVVASYDPVHAALPWAGVRLILQSVKKSLSDDNFSKIQSYESEIQKLLGSQTYESLCEIFDEQKLDKEKRDLVQDDRHNRKERKKILQALSSVQFRENHETTRAGRLENSGAWLLRRREFEDWNNSLDSSVLWLHGSPGSGKSSLVSIVIDSILEKQPHAYFYCSAEATQRLRSQPKEIMRCILKQLYVFSEESSTQAITKTFKGWEKEDGDYARIEHMSVQQSTDYILEILSHQQAPVKIVIDALDECDSKLRARLMGSIENIISQAKCPVKIFLSSRDDADIVRCLGDKSNIFIQASDNREDIAQFVENEVNDLVLLPAGLNSTQSAELKTHIKARLRQKAGGMFRWVSLQLQTIARLVTVPDIYAQLDNLPEGLEKSYDAVYRQIESSAEHGKFLAKRTLQWLLCAQIQLTRQAFLLAVSDGHDDPTLTAATIVDVCCNLVFLDESVNAFRFVHLSVQEYLQRCQGYSLETAHGTAAKTCLSTFIPLASTGHEKRVSQSLGEIDIESDESIEWRLYTTIYLPTHLRHVGTSSDASLQAYIAAFVSSTKDSPAPFEDWIRMFRKVQSYPEWFHEDMFFVSEQINIVLASEEHQMRHMTHATQPGQAATKKLQVIIEDPIIFCAGFARHELDTEVPQSRFLLPTFLSGNGKAMATDGLISTFMDTVYFDLRSQETILEAMSKDLEKSLPLFLMKLYEVALVKWPYNSLRTFVFPHVQERITDTMLVSAMYNDLHSQLLVQFLTRMWFKLGHTKVSDMATLDIMDWEKRVSTLRHPKVHDWLCNIKFLFGEKAFLPESPIFRDVLRMAVSQDCARLIQVLWENQVPVPQGTDLEELVRRAISEGRSKVLRLFLMMRLISNQDQAFETALKLAIKGGGKEQLLEQGIIEEESTEGNSAEEDSAEEGNIEEGHNEGDVAEEDVLEEENVEEDESLLQSKKDEMGVADRTGHVDEVGAKRMMDPVGDMAAGHESDVAKVLVGKPLIVLFVLILALITARITL
ncbi:hypothetical protein SLS58_010495 [Diplodia intermedia]|uniref:NACHT domain-containing protein n=1 Tax=Diplodia intermedia TaxID=856260 RepID=A0ABR3T5N9_9PEZI